jgi:hypothetical protein
METGQNNISTIQAVCLHCCKTFNRPLKDNWRKYCNKDCATRSKSKTLEVVSAPPAPLNSSFLSVLPIPPVLPNPAVTSTSCKYCCKTFLRPVTQEWRVYCSRDCDAEDKKKILDSLRVSESCQNCKKSFSRKKEDHWRRYCGSECALVAKFKVSSTENPYIDGGLQTNIPLVTSKVDSSPPILQLAIENDTPVEDTNHLAKEISTNPNPAVPSEAKASQSEETFFSKNHNTAIASGEIILPPFDSHNESTVETSQEKVSLTVPLEDQKSGKEEKACPQCSRKFLRGLEETWRLCCSSRCFEKYRDKLKVGMLEGRTQIVSCSVCLQLFPRDVEATWKTCCSKTCSILEKKKCLRCNKEFSREDSPLETPKEIPKEIPVTVPSTPMELLHLAPENMGPPSPALGKAEEKNNSFVISNSLNPQNLPQSPSNSQNINKPSEWKDFLHPENPCPPPNFNNPPPEEPKNTIHRNFNCCSQRCSELLIVQKICKKCFQPFSIIALEGWKSMCGKKDCIDKAKQSLDKRDNFSGTTSKVGYSLKALVWLESIAQKENINIQHMKNGGEYTIKYFNSFIRFDGFCKETNTVYEFYGDYWHGNPEIYKSEDLNPDTHSTFGQLYVKTLIREKYIRDQGYNLVTIWEKEYDSLF